MQVLSTGIASGADEGFLLSVMKRLELFASLSDEDLRKILYFVKAVIFDAGETAFRKGDSGDSFYVIDDGKVEARVPGGFFGGSQVIGTMGSGDFFGELALILNQPRAADIVCIEETSCFVLDRADLEILMERNPGIASAIKKIAKERFSS
jgi:CPA1 family monovalent cation:H+ antiporter